MTTFSLPTAPVLASLGHNRLLQARRACKLPTHLYRHRNHHRVASNVLCCIDAVDASLECAVGSMKRPASPAVERRDWAATGRTCVDMAALMRDLLTREMFESAAVLVRRPPHLQPVLPCPKLA
jgi:hypothetical protein